MTKPKLTKEQIKRFIKVFNAPTLVEFLKLSESDQALYSEWCWDYKYSKQK